MHWLNDHAVLRQLLVEKKLYKRVHSELLRLGEDQYGMWMQTIMGAMTGTESDGLIELLAGFIEAAVAAARTERLLRLKKKKLNGEFHKLVTAYDRQRKGK